MGEMCKCVNVKMCKCENANDQLGIGNWNWQHFHIGDIIKSALCFLMIAFSARAENAYTNHAGNVASGIVVALDARTATISNAMETVKLPLSIFPESEQRRIAADFGQPRVPAPVKRAIVGAEKAMARSRKRAEKGLCTKEESDDFCAKSAAALRNYLDKQVKEGVITPAERKAIGH